MSRSHLASVLAGSGALLVILGCGPARATPKTDDGHQVTLCHGTASDTNPYVEITVDVASVLGNHGHDGHEGPVWTPDHPKHEAWGDVIPAFDYGPSEQYDGMNLVDGAALLADHCELPAPTTTSTTEAPTTTSTAEVPSTSATAGSGVLGESGAETTTSSSTSSTTTEVPTTTTTAEVPSTSTTAGSGVMGESGAETTTSSSMSSTPITDPGHTTAIAGAGGTTREAVAAGGGSALPRTGMDSDLLASLGGALVLASLAILGLSRRAGLVQPGIRR